MSNELRFEKALDYNSTASIPAIETGFPLQDYIETVRLAVKLIQKSHLLDDDDYNFEQQKAIKLLKNTPKPSNFPCQFLSKNEQRDLDECLEFFDEEDDNNDVLDEPIPFRARKISFG